MSIAKTKEQGQIPWDFEPLLDQLQELMPYFDRRAAMAGLLGMMIYQENIRQAKEKQWIYALEYYGGKWVMVKRRGYVYTYDGYKEIVRRDTDATSAIGLAGALASMRTAIAGG